MKVWHDLVSTALLGTEREPLPPLQCEGGIGNALVAVNAQDQASKEETLLRAASLLELYMRAGAKPAIATQSAPAPCLDDTTPQCSAKAGALLSTLIVESNEALIIEWLQSARQNGKRIPNIILPPLLEIAVSKKNVASELKQSIGHRIRWLAAKNSVWQGLFERDVNAEDSKTVWETGEPPDRLAALRILRETQPAVARELLIQSWSQEPAEFRAAALNEFRSNLSMADEPFLEEKALDDKRKEVRVTAQELLALLPESRLSRRMIERVLPHVKFARVLLSHSFEISYAFEFEPSMARDGILQKRVTNLGEKSDYLLQMISRVPPDAWAKHFQVEPRKLVDTAAKKPEWQQILLQGWQNAAVIHHSSDWAELILSFSTQNSDELLACIEQSRKETLVLNIIRNAAGRINSSPQMLLLIAAFLRETGVLGVECSQVILQACKNECTTDPSYNNHVTSLLPSLALRLNSAVAKEVASGWREQLLEDNHVRKVLEQFMHTVDFRYEMHKSLKE